MLPDRFGTQPADTGGATPASQSVSTPPFATPPPDVAAPPVGATSGIAPTTRPKGRAIGTVPLVALALIGGALGGGAISATTRVGDLLAPPAVVRYAPTPVAPVSPAPAPAAPAPPAPAPARAAPVTAPLVAVPAIPVVPGITSPAQPANVASAVFAKINPAVVQIVVSGQARPGATQSGSGSGVVVDKRGYVLTNNHVVDGARAISVRFSDGTAREGRVLGTDRGNDLALLKVDLPASAAVAPLADSDKVQVGETAIAIGSPFGLDGTVTQGIISAVQRAWAPGDGRVRRGLIQTDAPINPGNSGGPLLNAAGEVVGITTMIESPVRGSVGVGFAVPINTARRILSQLEAGARLEPVWLGISGQELDATIARDQNLPVQAGILIQSVVPGSPAAQAGLRGGQGANERIARGGDVITAVDGQPITSVLRLTERLDGRKPGDTVTLTIIRDGQERTLSVTLRGWPQSSP